MDLAIQINLLIKDHFNRIYAILLEKGVDQDILNEVFKDAVYHLPENNGKRFLGPNLTPAIEDITRPNNIENTLKEEKLFKNTGNTNFGNEYQREEKMTQDWSKYTKNVIIIVNYTTRSHALFGDFEKTFVKFKLDYISKQKWFNYNQHLYFGKGYTLYKDKLTDLLDALKASNVPYRRLDSETFKKELTVPTILERDKKVVEKLKNVLQDEPETIKRFEAIIEKREAIIEKREKKDESKIIKLEKTEDQYNRKKIKNKWGNIEEKETGMIFLKIQKENIVIGYQNEEPKATEAGIRTVVPLTKLLQEEAKDRGYTYLTKDMITNIKKTDIKLGKDLEYVFDKHEIEEEFIDENFESTESEDSSSEDS